MDDGVSCDVHCSKWKYELGKVCLKDFYVATTEERQCVYI